MSGGWGWGNWWVMFILFLVPFAGSIFVTVYHLRRKEWKWFVLGLVFLLFYGTIMGLLVYTGIVERLS